MLKFQNVSFKGLTKEPWNFSTKILEAFLRLNCIFEKRMEKYKIRLQQPHTLIRNKECVQTHQIVLLFYCLGLSWFKSLCLLLLFLDICLVKVNSASPMQLFCLLTICTLALRNAYGTKFHMGIRWHVYVTEQVIKSVCWISQMNNLQSIICVTQSLAN